MAKIDRAGASARAAAVGELLQRLLREKPEYRQRWMGRAYRSNRPDAVNIAAVSTVVMEYLWDAGERPETASPRALRDRVRRALTGELCSPNTVTWLVAAFEMTQADATDLSRALHGLGGPGAAVGHLARGDFPEVQHRTRSLNEFHLIGPDRLPRRHRTVQVIESLVPGYRIYPFRFDTPHARVFVEEGGHASLVRPDRPGLWAVDITLAQPLHTGQTASVVYETQFTYPNPPPPEFRRGARTRVDSVNLRVRFHPAALPRQLWWAVWEDATAPTSQEPVALDPQHSAQRFLTLLDSSVVGFRWQW